MLDHDALTRYYSKLSDEALRDELSAGPEAYQPAAWSVITEVAAARGLRYVGLPTKTADEVRSVAVLEEHPLSLKERIAAVLVLVVWLLLGLNYRRGWHWFGDADLRVFELTVSVSILTCHWITPTVLARLRAYTDEKRARALQSIESDRERR